MKTTLNLSNPVYIYRAKLAALFELDEEVTVGAVENTEDGASVTIKVSSRVKADALRKVLKPSADFGGLALSVVIEDTSGEETPADILRAAFAYNRLFQGVETQDDPTGAVWTYLVAEPTVAQFPADNLADYRRNVSMLTADVARDVLTDVPGVAVCTADLREN